KASEDVMATARMAATLSLNALFIDIGRRGTTRGKPVAAAMGAEYCPLPYASSRAMSSLVTARIAADRK
ncbi:MAG: magnesium chelatase ATPase subunit D, partial [Phyllobacteriaceae bacterium]|nr:magnesium chelatase ATPase subunit D [Phyllobacteriaceae bacterium]